MALGFYDVYVLSPKRSAEMIDRFLGRFAPVREESADEYCVPRFSDTPEHLFRRASELIDFCVIHPREPQGIYWRSVAARDPAHAMAFFTTDAALILGLSVSADSDRWLAKLLAFTSAEVGLVLFEDPPPDTAAEFRALAHKSVRSEPW